jgi:hypothetical protein
MTLDFTELQEWFNRIVNDPHANAADKFIAYESTIRQLDAVTCTLRQNASLMLAAAVQRMAGAP